MLLKLSTLWSRVLLGLQTHSLLLIQSYEPDSHSSEELIKCYIICTVSRLNVPFEISSHVFALDGSRDGQRLHSWSNNIDNCVTLLGENIWKISWSLCTFTCGWLSWWSRKGKVHLLQEKRQWSCLVPNIMLSNYFTCFSWLKQQFVHENQQKIPTEPDWK